MSDLPKSNLQDRLAALSPEKRALLLAKLRRKQAPAQAAARPDAIPPAPRDRPLPLSYAQRRLWFLDQFEPGTPAYNVPELVRLVGALDVPTLARCLSEVVRRHEVLRTTFAVQGSDGDGEPVQVIAPARPIDLPVDDLSALPPGDQPGGREARCRAIAVDILNAPFDLAAGPLLRARLVRLAGDEHVLLLVIHHIVSDGWSTGILVHELTALYQAFTQGCPSPLPPLPLQYADFAVWQHHWLQSEAMTRQLDYWRDQLGSGDDALALPTDRPRPAIRTQRGGTVTFEVAADTVRALQTLGGRERASLFMVLQAALAALLVRYTRQDDIRIGTYIANRNRVEVESLIGFFLNTLVLRSDCSGDPDFRTLLGRVARTTLDAYANQDVPFEKLLEALRPARDMRVTPFFQVMLVLQNVPAPAGDTAALRLEPYHLRGEVHAHFDLTLWMVEHQGRIEATLEHNADLFDHATAQRMTEHYQTLLRGVAANPDQRLSELPILPAAERRRVLGAWSRRALDTGTGAGAALEDDRCIHHLFADHAARTPDAVAVVWPAMGDAPEQRLTYGDLAARANQLAHHLQALGVGPETRVGICMPRSAELLVAVLGVLAAGGTYVPLDPDYPPERLAGMAADSDMRALVTTAAQHTLLPSIDVPVVRLDRDHDAIVRHPTSAPHAGITPDTLAYVVFTSGSTGRPKGVMVSHRSLVNAYRGWADAYDLAALRCHLQMASFSFDVFAGDWVRALCAGATLVLCPRAWLLEPAALGDLITRERVDCGEFVPAVMRLLMDHLRAQDATLDTMRLVIVGSDVWDMREYHQLTTLCPPGTRVVSSYGLSEATIDSTFFETATPVPSEQVVPIGRPFAGTEVYVLDAHMQPVPTGVPGELHVGGPGLARGYIGRPDLTTERFVPHPFAAAPDARLYRTGDLVRWTADGDLAFLGRNDTQVKIRGHRIELDEVRAVLQGTAGVKEAVLLAHGDGEDKHLVAYLTAGAQATSPDALRQHLAARLPPHMVPSAFVILDALPLTPNGKVDVHALPRPTDLTRPTGAGHVPPRNPTEVQLAAIWEDVLDVHPIGVNDDFFALGGHSLLAVRLMAQIRDRTGHHLPLAILFQGATIERLALAMTAHDSTPAAWSPLVTIQPGEPGQMPLFCVPGAGGNVIYFHDLARQLGRLQPVHGLQARGLDGISPPHDSVEEMAACYLDAVRTVQPHGPYALAGHSFGTLVAFEMAQQLMRAGEPVALLAIFNSPIPRLEPEPAEQAAEAPAFDDAAWMESLAGSVGRLYGADLGITAAAMRPLAPEARYQDLTRRLIDAHVLPPGTDSSMVRGLVQVFKAAYRIDYIPRDPAPVPVVFFRAAQPHEDDGDVPPDIAREPAWGWNRLASRPVPVELVPGDHMTMMAQPQVQHLAERLRHHIQRAMEERRS